MTQVKIYGLAEHLEPRRGCLSDVIHSCLVEALGLPENKRFQRFFPLAPENFVFPLDRTAHYTIIEISLFEGRAMDRKKQLLRLLFERIAAECALTPQDIEITLTETPRANWGIRGLPADELDLPYKITSDETPAI